MSPIHWSDPKDSIRRVVIPCMEELEEGGRLDAWDETRHTVIPGLQHKYRSTALLMVSNPRAYRLDDYEEAGRSFQAMVQETDRRYGALM